MIIFSLSLRTNKEEKLNPGVGNEIIEEIQQLKTKIR